MGAQSLLQSAADQTADKYGIPRALFSSLISVESSWNSAALSPKGAIGLTQLLPTTAAELSVDPWNPLSNLEGGAQYLAQQFQRFGNWRDALAAYNTGPNNIAAGQGYAATVISGANKMASQFGPSAVVPGGTPGAINPFDNAGWPVNGYPPQGAPAPAGAIGSFGLAPINTDPTGTAGKPFGLSAMDWLGSFFPATSNPSSLLGKITGHELPPNTMTDAAGKVTGVNVTAISKNLVFYTIGGVVVIGLIMVGVSSLTRGK